MKKVLIVSHREDGTSKLLSKRLAEMKQPYEIIDISQFPRNSASAIDYSDDRLFTFTQGRRGFKIDDVKSIWWRRPMGKQKPEPKHSIDKYIKMESDVFVRSLFYLLPKTVRWVSDPDSTRIANSKPLQLQVAREIGFNIPKTLISNDPSAVKRFIKKNLTMKMIMKPVGTSFYKSTAKEGGSRTIYTRIINTEELIANIEKVSNCPVIFQEAICNKIDLRATVVGNKVFTVSITHERDLGAGEDNLDWRNHKLERIFKPYHLPIDIQRKCVAVVNGLGLQFGAIDLCVSDSGKYYFFEINPQGQWIPSEMVAGLPISETLARFLANI